MLSAQTTFLISLFILLASALIAGEIALRLGQLALVGQLLVGILLGPTLLGPSVGLSTVSPYLSAVQVLATFFLLFLAGLEMGPEQVYRMPVSTVVLGILIFVVPFLITFVVGRAVAPSLGLLTTLFVAVTLSITALPVMSVMVKELGLVGSRFGTVLMGAALVNELAAVTAFAVLLQYYNAGSHASLLSVGLAFGATGVFLAVVFGANLLLRAARKRPGWDQSWSKISRSVRTREAGFAILMAMGLGAALLSQYLGLTFVIGAFYAGILVTPESVGTKARDGARAVLYVIVWGLFLPLFFAITGLQTNFRLLATATAFVAFVALLFAAMFSKIGVGTGFAISQRWNDPDAAALGYLVNSRGAVEIAMAVILYTDGILDTYWFTLVVAVGMVCTVVAPMGAVFSWNSTPESRAALLERAPSLVRRRAYLAPVRGSDASPGGPTSGLQVTFTPPPGRDAEPRVIRLTPEPSQETTDIPVDDREPP